MPAYLVAEIEITTSAGLDPYLGGGRRYDHPVWRPGSELIIAATQPALPDL
jgi:hypothetical protein